MTQDEIIEMAIQAGIPSANVPSLAFGRVETGIELLEAFAKKVAEKAVAKEREALVLFLRNLADDHTPTDCADMICALQSLSAIRARGQA